MPQHIPPVPIAERSAAEFASLRNLFQFAGFNEATVCTRLQLNHLSDVRPEIVRRNETGELASASDTLIRLFVEGWPVATADLERTITPQGIELLNNFRLLMPFSDGVQAATVSLYPIENLFVASDRYNNADGTMYDGWDDLVYPCLFTTTRKFIESIPRSACNEALDMGAGTGIGAMLLAPTAKRVVATDLVARCEPFILFNARLNGFSNIESVTGDLYSGLGDQKFDRIIAHPPYQPVMEHVATFNSGGPDGEQISRRIITGAPAHLKPGGQLFCLCQLTDRDHPIEARVRNWMPAGESESCDIAFLAYRHMDPSRYTAIETLQERKNHGAWKAWMEALNGASVSDMVYGMVVVQKAVEARPVFTVRREGASSVPSDLPALVEWETRASQPGFAEWLASAKPVARPGTEMQVTHQLTGGQWKSSRLRISRSDPYETGIDVDPVTANLLATMDGTRTCVELRSSLPFQVAPEQFAGLIRMLVSNGFVQI